jgi:hypothetical protein
LGTWAKTTEGKPSNNIALAMTRMLRPPNCGPNY